MDITSESSVPLPYCADIATHNAAQSTVATALIFNGVPVDTAHLPVETAHLPVDTAHQAQFYVQYL